jgi:phosphoserine phosphatase
VARGLVFFDVDGTLIPGTSSGQHLADPLGHGDAMREAEDGYAAGARSDVEVATLDARNYANRTPAEIRGFLASMPLVDGIAETLAWTDVGTDLCERFGFDRACGARQALADGRYSGEVAEHLDEFGKRDFAPSVAAEFGLEPSRCAAIGDSRSDLPLFAEVGLAIAFNGTAGGSRRRPCGRERPRPAGRRTAARGVARPLNRLVPDADPSCGYRPTDESGRTVLAGAAVPRRTR